jgi:hypothetical protein
VHLFLVQILTIKHPDMSETLLNPRGVPTVSHKYSLTLARHATVVVAVPSTVHYPLNYKIKIYYFRRN